MISFSFKTDWAQYGLNFNYMKKVASECERLGYDSIIFHDHLFYPDRPDVPTYETWTMMSALAAVTSHIRLGTMVLSNLFRYPPLLAKMASTLDHVSGGRLDFGIGAGYPNTMDNYAFGFQSYDAPTRLRRLEEAVKLIKMMWTEERANFQGRYYTLRDAICSPKPVQKPYPPMWIGGRGEKVTLRIVAEHADGCNFIHVLPEEYERLLGVLEGHCRRAGRNFSEIKKSMSAYVHIAKDEKEAREKALKYKLSHWRESTRETPLEEYLRINIVGTPEQCIDGIEEFVKLGVTHCWLLFPDVHQGDLEGLELFAERVMPAFNGN